MSLRMDDFIKAQLVLFAWREGRGWGGYLASCMILSTIVNRQRAGWGSWLSLLDGAPSKAGSLVPATGSPDLWEPNFVKLLHEVSALYEGAKDYASGALYYCDSARIDNEWFKVKILGNPQEHPRIGEMGTLMLFR
jgi:hypothetical protein